MTNTPITNSLWRNLMEQCAKVGIHPTYCDGIFSLLRDFRDIEERAARSESSLKTAWEAGFALCSSYGDNKHHFRGEQKENNWKKFLDTLNHD